MVLAVPVYNNDGDAAVAAPPVSCRIVRRGKIPLDMGDTIHFCFPYRSGSGLLLLAIHGRLHDIHCIDVRRGSVIVPFLYGVFILHERNVRAKVIDLGVLLVSLLLLVLGSR